MCSSDLGITPEMMEALETQKDTEQMDEGSGSFTSWENTKCNPLGTMRQQALNAWKDGYASAQREWVGLTTEDIKNIYFVLKVQWAGYTDVDVCRAIEAKLREKNT